VAISPGLKNNIWDWVWKRDIRVDTTVHGDVVQYRECLSGQSHFSEFHTPPDWRSDAWEMLEGIKLDPRDLMYLAILQTKQFKAEVGSQIAALPRALTNGMRS
jgi:hypothetical protein